MRTGEDGNGLSRPVLFICSIVPSYGAVARGEVVLDFSSSGLIVACITLFAPD